jgi:hypothetical protein
MLSGYWNGGVGCSVEVLAELIGDTPKVAFDHYGREWGQHYQKPLWAAIGVAWPQPETPDPGQGMEQSQRKIPHGRYRHAAGGKPQRRKRPGR